MFRRLDDRGGYNDASSSITHRLVKSVIFRSKHDGGTFEFITLYTNLVEMILEFFL